MVVYEYFLLVSDSNHDMQLRPISMPYCNGGTQEKDVTSNDEYLSVMFDRMSNHVNRLQ